MELFTTINTKDKLYNKILKQIQTLIINGILKPGDKLPPERQLAETLNVSRHALKQALSILEALNIIECRQGDGNYVMPFENKLFNPIVMDFYASHGKTDDILEVRYILEVQTVKILALKITEQQLTELEKTVELMKGKKNLEERVTLNNQFHSQLISYNGNPLMTNFYNSILELIGLQIATTDGTNFYPSHKSILQALKGGDPEKAAQYMVGHFTTKFPNYKYYNNI